MRYRAECDCTDFDGRFYALGQEVELPSEVEHSGHLIPLEKSDEPIQSQDSEPAGGSVEEAVQEAVPQKPRRRTKQAGA